MCAAVHSAERHLHFEAAVGIGELPREQMDIAIRRRVGAFQTTAFRRANPAAGSTNTRGRSTRGWGRVVPIAAERCFVGLRSVAGFRRGGEVRLGGLPRHGETRADGRGVLQKTTTMNLAHDFGGEYVEGIVLVLVESHWPEA